MVSFTLHLIGWILCALFRFFVIGGTIYGIYSFIRDKLNDISRNRYLRECQKQHEMEMEEAKRRIIKSQGGIIEEDSPQMTEEQIKEEKQINGEIKFVLLVIGITIILGGIIFLIKNFG